MAAAPRFPPVCVPLIAGATIVARVLLRAGRCATWPLARALPRRGALHTRCALAAATATPASARARAAGMADLSISVDNPIHSSPLGVISSASMTGPARAKMDELFCSWLALPETAGLVNGWISDLKAGKPLVPPKISTPSLRVSPVRHAPPGSPTRVGPAAAGFSPPLSPSRYAQRPSPTIGRFGFGEAASHARHLHPPLRHRARLGRGRLRNSG